MKLILALAIITLLTACGGGGGDDSNNNTQATTDTPQTPSAPTATVQGANQINLSWSEVSGASYYHLYSSDSSNSEIYAGSNTIHSNTGLTANTFYSYTLKACTDSNTCSSVSSTTSATTTQSSGGGSQTPSPTLNDTGITWGGNATGNNTTTCTSSIDAPQDCHYGRDASLTISGSTFTYATDGSKIAKVGAGAAGFDFTKLSSTGTILPASADSWSCVKDNVTGLVWEVKTDLGTSDTYSESGGVRTYTYNNIHHKDNTYRWGGLSAVGRNHASPEGAYNYDWNILVNGSNSESGLCGFSDWRVPTINELRNIAHKGKANPAIDTNYFPNTPANYFWSASPVASNSNYAWLLGFSNGYDFNYNRDNRYRVRLVRVGE